MIHSFLRRREWRDGFGCELSSHGRRTPKGQQLGPRAPQTRVCKRALTAPPRARLCASETFRPQGTQGHAPFPVIPSAKSAPGFGGGARRAQAQWAAEVATREIRRGLPGSAKGPAFLLRRFLGREAPGGRTCLPAQAPPLPSPSPGAAAGRFPLLLPRWRSTPQVRGRDAGVAEESGPGYLTVVLRLGAGLGKVPSAEVAPLPQTAAPARPAGCFRVSGGPSFFPAVLGHLPAPWGSG